MTSSKPDPLGANERLLARLTEALTLIARAGSLDQVLQTITHQARELVGAHQAALSLAAGKDRAQALTAVSLSEKYSDWREYKVAPGGSDICSLVCRKNQTLRLTQQELESHEAWKGFGSERDRHPPMRGWLAVPLVDDGGANLGLIQLSDKYDGDFTEQDEFITRQLSLFGAVAIQKTQLQESALEARSEAAERDAQLQKTIEDFERQRSELELNKEQLELVFSSLDVGFWYNELPLGRLVWNSQVKRHFGLPPEAELTIEDFYRFLHPEDRERIREEVDGAVATESLFDTEYRTNGPDGIQRWIRAIGRVLYTKPRRFGGITLDISKTKQTQDALQRALEQLHLAVEAAEISTWTLEPGASVRECLQALGPIEEQDIRHFKDALKAGRDCDSRLEVDLQTRVDGKTRWLSLVGRRLPTDSVVGVARDVTLQKEAEEALRKARDEAVQASQLKSQFLANVSHEIRTPLVGLLGMVDFLKNTGLDREQQEHTDTLRECANTLKTVVDDVLTLSHIEAGKLEWNPQPCNLPQLLKRCRDLFLPRAHEKGLEFQLKLAADLPTLIKADRGRLLQVLSNLITNALKFTSAGSISLAAEVSKQGYVRLAVTDTGIGISGESLPRLYEPFVQVDSSSSRVYGGTGLGLSIVKRLAEYMDGRTWAESERGVGSTFFVEFPVQEIEASEVQTGDVPDEGQTFLGHWKVLVAEDNPINRRVISMQLEKLGCEVFTVQDGQQAVDALLEQNVDAVFMDCQMPGVDGYEATRRIRKLESPVREVPIIALTAHALGGEREKCLACGMNDYLTKPLSLVKLRQALNGLAESRQG